MASISMSKDDPIFSANNMELHSSGSVKLESQKSLDNDSLALSRTGKVPVLKRNFGMVAMIGFSCLILGTWEATLVLFGIGFNNGGPAGLVYGFLVVWAGTMATFTSLAELASMAPTSGGQYHWVSLLAPAKSQKIFSYVTGWLTVAGWQAAVSSANYLVATIIQGLIELVDPNYIPKLWHTTLLLYASVFFCVFMNTVVGIYLPKAESALLIVYVLGFFAVMVPLVFLAPHGSAKDVFATFINNGGWSTQGLSFFVGLTGNAFGFLGADSVYHLSEEVRNAAVVVPRAMVIGIFVNGVVGTAMYIAVLFCIGDIDKVLGSTFSSPFIEIFLQATNSVVGSALMVSIIIIVLLGLCIGTMAAASRQLWSFARDRGVPFWKQISKVGTTTSIPIASVVTTTIGSLLLSLISVGSPVAFNDVISLTLAALYSSYLIACVLLLWRRCTGSIKTMAQYNAENHQNKAPNLPGSAGNLVWGPWRISGAFGIVINVFACLYMILILIFTFWPPVTPVTPVSMNYSSLVFGFVAIFSFLYYILWAHKTYKGPVVEIAERY